MKTTLVLAFALAFLNLSAPAQQPTIAPERGSAPVTVVDNGSSWTLSNGIVQAMVTKNNASMPSFRFHGQEMLKASGGTWEHTPQGAPEVTNTVTIDPATNHGDRAEVAVKGITNGTFMLTRGAPGGGSLCDMEIRYSLGKGDSGIYVYAIWRHPASYPAAGTGAEDRYITRLTQDFDWITVDKDRNMLEAAPLDWGTGVVVHAKEQRIMSQGVYKNSVEHKYTYAGSAYHAPAYGWSSTKRHVGMWFINPSTEYLSGGPDRIDLDAHFGDNGDPEPIILDYWHSGHYTGARTSIAAGEQWSKVIGPIFVYANALGTFHPTSAKELATLAATAGNPTVPASWTANADALWHDALRQAKAETSKWPYTWVDVPEYVPAAGRGSVTGQLVLDDPLAPAGSSTRLPNLLVGLTHPDAPPAPLPADMPARWRAVAALWTGPGSWKHDARYYQFFSDGREDGRFRINEVPAGHYTLHATANGVLGDYQQADVTVEPGKTVDLGRIVWKPVRYGRQVWEIGYPDRAADEFLKGDGHNYWLWGWNLRYALLFPHDLTYTIGKSTPGKDWFFEEVPHADNLAFVNPAARDPANQPFGWVKAESLAQYPQNDQQGPWAVYGRGRETVWIVRFTMPRSAHGEAALRVAFAGVDGLRNGLAVGLNGASLGALGDNSTPDNTRLIQTNAIRYNTDKGLWQQRTLHFDADKLRPGSNEMTFTVPAGDLQSGVVWDYLRLELKEQ